jgi:mono/diheme cytochrome c family protein
MTPNLWTHCAITRDDQGRFKIYRDGVLDTDKSTPNKMDFTNLEIGQSTARGGSEFQIREFRVWNREKSAREIRDDYQTVYSSQKHENLLHRISGDSDSIKLRGKASIQLVNDSPALVAPEVARAAQEKFAKYLTMADKQGSTEQGKLLFATCLACHKVGKSGGIIGPDLSGAGAMSTEALLHNILTSERSDGERLLSSRHHPQGRQQSQRLTCQSNKGSTQHSTHWHRHPAHPPR